MDPITYEDVAESLDLVDWLLDQAETVTKVNTPVKILRETIKEIVKKHDEVDSLAAKMEDLQVTAGNEKDDLKREVVELESRLTTSNERFERTERERATEREMFREHHEHAKDQLKAGKKAEEQRTALEAECLALRARVKTLESEKTEWVAKEPALEEERRSFEEQKARFEEERAGWAEERRQERQVEEAGEGEPLRKKTKLSPHKAVDDLLSEFVGRPVGGDDVSFARLPTAVREQVRTLYESWDVNGKKIDWRFSRRRPDQLKVYDTYVKWQGRVGAALEPVPTVAPDDETLRSCRVFILSSGGQQKPRLLPLPDELRGQCSLDEPGYWMLSEDLQTT